MTQAQLTQNEFSYYDEFPNEDPFELVPEVHPHESLAYRDEVSTNLINLLHEYLSFATMREFICLLANNL